MQAGQMKAQMSKLRDEKVSAEKKLFDAEFRINELQT